MLSQGGSCEQSGFCPLLGVSITDFVFPGWTEVSGTFGAVGQFPSCRHVLAERGGSASCSGRALVVIWTDSLATNWTQKHLGWAGFVCSWNWWWLLRLSGIPLDDEEGEEDEE